MPKALLLFSSILLLLISGCDPSDKPAPEVSLTADATTIDYNATLRMTWSASGVDYCLASGDWSGNIKFSGTKILGPLTRDSFYLLDCYDSGKLISKSVSIDVRDPQIPRVNLSASPLSIGYGGATTITWKSQHVADCIADGDWSGNKEPNGSVKMERMITDSEYRLICNGPQGEASDSISINVYEPGIEVPQVRLTATPAKTSFNGSTTLSWETTGADICRASGAWFGSKARSGTQGIGQLTQDSRFIMTCTIAGGGGGEGIDVAEVSVDPAPAPVVKLSASASQVSINSSITLRWSSSHADSCIAIGDWTGTRRFSGTQTIANVKKDSLFALQCIGIGGTGTDSVNITLTDNTQ